MRKPKRIKGSCIAGPPSDPRIWYRDLGDMGYEKFAGRLNMNVGAVAAGHPKREFNCPLRQRDPIEFCRPCVAYRPDGRKPVLHGADQMPIALREKEYDRMTDDSEAYFARLDGKAGAVATLAHGFTEDTLIPGLDVEMYDQIAEYRRETVRRWRAAHPGADKRKRNRAEYMRDYRKRNPKFTYTPFRSSVSRPSMLITSSGRESISPETAESRARARGSGELRVTEEATQ